MANLIHYTRCPVCDSTSISNVLSVKDCTVSQQFFPIAECSNCSLRFTQDVPDAASIGPWYKSEDYISHTNTSKGVINRLYQAVRKRTMRAKRKLVQQVTGVDRGKLLDMGSGIGTFANEMSQSGWDVTALEPDSGAREIARQLYNIEEGSLDQFYTLPAGGFDAVTLWHVLEHVHDLQGYVRQLKTVLSAKGKLIIAVPNYTSGDAAAYKASWAAYDVPRHLYHFSPKSMGVLLQRHGLQIVKCRPMWYDSFYISMLSSKYTSGKVNLVSAFLNGLSSNIKALGDVKRCSSVIYVISKE